jgi:hypothetical protein
MQLKPYADIALINAMLSSATAEDDFDKAQATVSAILHYYFLIADGFLVTFHSGTPQKLPHYFLIRRMDKNGEEIRLWAVLFMPKEGESTDWVDQLYQMLQTGIPGIPENGGCWVIICDLQELNFFRYRARQETGRLLDPRVHSEVKSGGLNLKDDKISIHRIFNLALHEEA